MSDGPLSGVRVIDLTNVIMGPLATHILADMGADVIKVESADGDLFREYKPARSPGMYGAFLHLNRNKRSIVLDLKDARERETLDALIATADVFVHALRPKAIERLGYTYAKVRAIKEDIVYCGAYGFGADGPYGDKAAYDDLIQAGSGMAATFVPLDGVPRYIPNVVCDKLAGQAMAYAILAALYRRATTGAGDEIEVPMFETAIEFLAIENFSGYAFEPPLSDFGFPRMRAKSRKPYKTLDGYACILPYSDANWREFFAFTGNDELGADPRYAKLGERLQHIEELYALLEREAAKRPTSAWVEFCDRVSIPCMPVLRFEELADDPHVRAVGLFSDEIHPTEGRYRGLRAPWKFRSSKFTIRRHAPRLGEHTSEIRTELASDEPALAVDAFDHVVINVRDVAAAAAWYVRVLGMEREDFDPGNGGLARTSLRFGAQKINLRPVDASKDEWFTADHEAAGSEDLCFLTTVTPARVVEHLRACGVAVEAGPVERRRARGTLRSVYCRDPDGNLIEIASY